jgi:hypothetical protein
MEASIQVGSTTLNVVVVYAPAEATARRTWMETHLTPEHISLPSIDLLLGDFNYSPEPSGRAVDSFHLKTFVDFYGLTRIPPVNTDYMFLSPTRGKSLIDHIFIRPDLAQLVLQCKTVPPPKSNHLLTSTSITRSPRKVDPSGAFILVQPGLKS